MSTGGSRSRMRRCSSPYRGAAGLSERYFLALLDRDYQVVARASPTFATLPEAMRAWRSRRDRRARLVRMLNVLEVLA